MQENLKWFQCCETRKNGKNMLWCFAQATDNVENLATWADYVKSEIRYTLGMVNDHSEKIFAKVEEYATARNGMLPKLKKNYNSIVSEIGKLVEYEGKLIE